MTETFDYLAFKNLSKWGRKIVTLSGPGPLTLVAPQSLVDLLYSKILRSLNFNIAVEAIHELPYKWLKFSSSGINNILKNKNLDKNPLYNLCFCFCPFLVVLIYLFSRPHFPKPRLFVPAYIWTRLKMVCLVQQRSKFRFDTFIVFAVPLVNVEVHISSSCQQFAT